MYSLNASCCHSASVALEWESRSIYKGYKSIVNCGNSAGQYNILSVPVALETAEKTAKM